MLKALLLRKKITERQKELDAVIAAAAALATREADLAKSIDEVQTDEERAAVEEAVAAFEKDKVDNEELKESLEREIGELESELAELEREQSTQPENATAENQRNEVFPMNTRANFFGMNMQERDAFMQREDVKKFLGDIKTSIMEKRALSGTAYLIPDVMLGLLRENIENYSKLYSRVNVQRLSGTGRMVIEGTVPEAVWTEMCANINELSLSWTQVEVDGFKVGGYFKICNAILQDSDIDLAREVLDVLGRAIGLALDKAILFGTGTKMPTGILTALEAVTGTPNIVSHAASVADLALFKALVGDAGLAKTNYSRGNMTWVMNETTRTTLIQNAMSFSAAGAIVSGVDGAMPIIGGDIVVLNFVPDNVVIAGYMDLYLLAERRGVELNTSEHAFFLADQTAFKGTARYDGKVVDDGAFVAIGLNGETPDSSDVTFASDSAN